MCPKFTQHATDGLELGHNFLLISSSDTLVLHEDGLERKAREGQLRSLLVPRRVGRTRDEHNNLLQRLKVLSSVDVRSETDPRERNVSSDKDRRVQQPPHSLHLRRRGLETAAVPVLRAARLRGQKGVIKSI